MRPRALTGTALAAAIALTSAAETYRGIDVAPEHRCAPYDRGDYRYSQAIEPRIVASLGKVYGPYTGTCFPEHGRDGHRAHGGNLGGARQRPVYGATVGEGGVCVRPAEPDPGQSGRQPVQQERQGCRRVDACVERMLGFVARTLEVRRKYELTIDRREAAAVEAVLSGCAGTLMEVLPCAASTLPVTPVPHPRRVP